MTLRRSREWLESPDLYSWLRKAAWRSMGFSPAATDGRPIIGIANAWSELTHCNAHLRDLAEHVKRGVWQAGGFPLEFPVSSLGEFNLRPTAMLWRNLLSMDVEEAIRGNPLDGVVLLAGCDKTTPGMLMGAASADIPTIVMTGGPQLNGHWRGEPLGSCTDCRRYQLELRAGRITTDDWAELQGCIIRSPGHCASMGTASTMAALTEALGIALPGNGATPAVDSRRAQLAEASGRQIVKLVEMNLTPTRILTPAAFDNAIRTLHALGGSTNAVIHLIAIAGRVGIDLPLRRFDELSRDTPFLANVKPSGQFLMEDFFHAGGVPAVLNALAPLLHLVVPTVTGKTLGENIASAGAFNREVIRDLSNPISTEGGLAVLTGSLAPKGAVIKVTAASPDLLRHRGRAVVFDDHDEMTRAMDDESLEIHPTDVLVLRNAGPLGGPGMPEWGFLPLPKKLLKAGVRDMVRVSDARMSGTAFGTVVVHVTPESAAGGPLAAVRTGDEIEMDVPSRRLDLCVEENEIQRRLAELPARCERAHRGYAVLFERHVTQADCGCDFDFLQGAKHGLSAR